MRRFALAVPVAVLLLSACSSKTETEAGKASADTTAKAKPAAMRSENPIQLTQPHQNVIRKLNQEGMLLIPAVRAKSDSMMKEIQAGKMNIEGGAAAFDVWLTTYAAAHPAEIEKAKTERAAQMKAMPASTNPVVREVRPGSPKPTPMPMQAPISVSKP